MKKVIFYVPMLMFGFSYAVTPGEQPKQGLKRYINEIMPVEEPSLEDLQRAAQNATAAQLRLLLDATDIDINSTATDDGDDEGNTLLMIAADHGNLDTFNLLLQRGANPYIPNNMGENVFHVAARKDNRAILERLLQVQGLHFNLTNGEGNTPLVIAILNHNNNVTDFLLRPEIIARGLDINKSNIHGDFPLSHAIEYQDLALVDKLLSLGASTSREDMGGELPLHLAVTNGNRAIIERLLNSPDINVNLANEMGETALMIAAYFGNIPIARLLIQKGAMIALTDSMGRTAIDYAKDSQNRSKKEMIKLLRDKNRSQQAFLK